MHHSLVSGGGTGVRNLTLGRVLGAPGEVQDQPPLRDVRSGLEQIISYHSDWAQVIQDRATSNCNN